VESVAGIVWNLHIGIEPRIWDEWDRFIIYIKIPFMIIIVEVVPRKNDQWMGTQFDALDRLRVEDVSSIPRYVSLLVAHYHNAFLESKEKLSEVQAKIIERDMNRADRNSGSFKTMKKNRITE
jgi:hypothetical protein